MALMSWDVSDLQTAADVFGDAAATLTATADTITPLNTAAYGQFVGSVAAHTEPATSQANARLVRATGSVAADIDAELRQSAKLYAATEADAVAQVAKLRQLGTGG